MTAKTKLKTTKKPSSKKVTTAKKPRVIEKPKYKSFRLSKRIRHDAESLPKARKIFREAWNHIGKHKKLFFGILFVQLILTLVLVRGFGVFFSDLPDTRDIVEELLGTDSALYTGATLIGVLLTSTSATSEVAGLYGTLLLLIGSLATIWALRQTHAHSKPKIKQAYYSGMYPVIPFLLVLLVILLQLLPLLIGNFLYNIVTTHGIAVTGLEQTIWILLFIGLGLLSLYMITSSLFALYIVTLPDVTPVQALRSARQLVLHRRMTVIRKLLFLPFVLVVIGIVIMLPIVIYLTAIAEVVFFVLSLVALLISHAYLYELYRKLL